MDIKIKFKMCYKDYEFVVLQFDLKFSIAMFMLSINGVLNIYLDKLILVFVDDILIYSNVEKNHNEHSQNILEV